MYEANVKIYYKNRNIPVSHDYKTEITQNITLQILRYIRVPSTCRPLADKSCFRRT